MIEATEYSRPETFNPTSRVRACRTNFDCLQRCWKVYCTYGPTWVWNHHTEEWVITTSIDPKAPDYVFRMTKEQALQVLATVSSKDEEEHGGPSRKDRLASVARQVFLAADNDDPDATRFQAIKAVYNASREDGGKFLGLREAKLFVETRFNF
jgi:hypothetical protein